MKQGKIMEAEVPTVRVGTTPTRLMAPPPPLPSKVFYTPDALPAAQPTRNLLQAHYMPLLHQLIRDRWHRPIAYVFFAFRWAEA